MLQNYLKTAFRNLWRKRQISAINFLGMLVALTVVMLIFIHDEQRFDQFHTNRGGLYRVSNFFDLFSFKLLAFVTVGKEAIVRARANPVQRLQEE